MTVTKTGGRGRASGPRVLLFDLDDTLYRNPEIPHQVRMAISTYIDRHLNQDGSITETPQYVYTLYQQYGTTLAGLVARGHQIDFDHWHQTVHYGMLDYASLLKPDPVLRDILSSIDIPKYVLTNADKRHAELCLERLGISDLFKEVYHFEWVQEEAKRQGLLSEEFPVQCKPLKPTYQMVLEHIGVPATEVMFFDDSTRNLSTAHEMGMCTVLVGHDPASGPVPGADLVLSSMHDLPKAVPELLDTPGLVHATHADAAAQAHSTQAGPSVSAIPA